MSKYQHLFRTPEKLTQQYLHYFVADTTRLFQMKGKEVSGVLFDTKQTKEVNILGVLLIYKFFEYSILEKCFKSPKCTLNECANLQKTLSKYGFKDMVDQFLKDKIPEDYSMVFNQGKDGVFIAPMTLNRGQSKETTEARYSSKIRDYYSYDETIVFIILQCLGEIASNFVEHAVDDTKSILVASGNKQYFEIACADTGNGIVSTLGPVVGGKNLQKFEIVEKALSKGVTSKRNSGHMGYGLWLVDEFTAATKGDLCVCSEGGIVYRHGHHIKRRDCGHWKGTIVYVKIPLNNMDSLHAALARMKDQYVNI